MRKALIATIGYVAIGMIVWPILEGWDVVQALYFTFVCLTTVGYGDFSPATDEGKAVSCVFVFVGIGLIASALGIVAGWVMDKMEEAAEAEKAVAAKSPEEREAEDAAAAARGSWLSPIQWALVWILVCVAVGTGLYWQIGDYELGNALYMSCISVVTVGFGDMSPVDQVKGANNETGVCLYGKDELNYEGTTGIPSDYQLQCYSCMISAVIWLVMATVVVSNGLGKVVDSYVQAKVEAARQKILNKKLTIEDLIEADDDNSGTVSMAEFVVYKLEMMNLVQKDVLDTIIDQFKRVDADGSGELTHEDIQAAIDAGKM